MQLNTDFHSHVSRSSAQKMVQAAREKGIHVLGLSEHIFQLHEGYALLPHMPLEGPLLSLEHYLTSVRQAACDEAWDVRLGLEVDFIPTKNEQIQQFLQTQDWDFLIGSVHEVVGKQFESSTISREEGEDLWLRYQALLRAAVNSGYFSLVSHPVRMRRTNPYLPPTLDDELEQLAADATRKDIALELNGHDILTYPDLVKRLARACALHNTPISVGSDAHNPTQIARAHPQTQAIMREAGLRKVRIWKQGVPEEYTLDF